MSKFKQYQRKQIAELRSVTDKDIIDFKDNTNFRFLISDSDRINGSPKIGDMIARNPKNHECQWLMAEQYFNDNFND